MRLHSTFVPRRPSRKAVMEDEPSLQDAGVGTEAEGQIPDAALGTASASSVQAGCGSGLVVEPERPK